MHKINKDTYIQAMERVKDALKAGGSPPNPNRPKGFGENFDFPDDLHLESLSTIGQLMGKLAAFRGYTTRLLGTQEATLSVVTSVYEVVLGYAMHDVARENSAGRILKDAQQSLAFDQSEDLAWLYEEKIKLDAVVLKLRSQLTIYDQYYQALSREISRRDTESRS